MFCRKLRVEWAPPRDASKAATASAASAAQPCPLKWLDSFAMRNFTNDPAFDDTLPIADGLLEAGSRVPLDRLRAAMADWFRRKGYLPAGSELLLTEEGAAKWCAP